MKTLILISIFAFSIQTSNAQDIFQKNRLKDTIRIVADKIDIKTVFKYKPLEKIRNNDTIVQNFYINNMPGMITHIKEILKFHKTEIEQYNPVEIIYNEVPLSQTLTFSQIKPEIKYYYQPYEKEKPNILKVKMYGGDYTEIRFFDINDILVFDFENMFNQLYKQKIETHWYSELYEFHFKNNLLKADRDFIEWTDSYISSVDILTGVSLLKQKPTLDFGLGISLILEKEEMNNILLLKKISLGYRYLTYYDESSQRAKLNGFIEGTYALNIPRTNRWIGLEVGYLAHRQGELFEKNTFMAGLTFIGGKIDFSPKVYFSKNSVFPALSIAFTGW